MRRQATTFLQYFFGVGVGDSIFARGVCHVIGVTISVILLGGLLSLLISYSIAWTLRKGKAKDFWNSWGVFVFFAVFFLFILLIEQHEHQTSIAAVRWGAENNRHNKLRRFKPNSDVKTVAQSSATEESLRTTTVLNSMKHCPGCGAAVDRIEGCDHMICAICKTHWDFESGAFADAAGYDDEYWGDY